MLSRWAAAAGEEDMGRDGDPRSHPFLHVEAEHDPLPPVFSLEGLLGMNAFSLQVAQGPCWGLP